MAAQAIDLPDRYGMEHGKVYLTGMQALVRLPLVQRRRDLAAGLNTAGFISGYRGSPLGMLDQALWQAQPVLDEHRIHFQPGVNEELGATAVWGSQQVNLFKGARHDGVFGLWYGKGPGVDRSGDVFKHANAAGTSRHGGVLVLAGDDHGCKSSTFPHQSEQAFIHAMMPVLSPSSIQELIDYGLIGWGMSRFSGCWVAMKAVSDTADGSASVLVDTHGLTLSDPADFELPSGGLGIRWPDPPVEQERRLLDLKLPAAIAYARANGLDRVVLGSPRARIGIVTTGKAYLDVRQALDELRIDEGRAAAWGLAVYKVGMPWPLDTGSMLRFAGGLEELLVVEEKRSLIEAQIKDAFYHLAPDARPRVIGKTDEAGRPCLPSTGELSPIEVALAIGRRLLRFVDDEGLRSEVARLEQVGRRPAPVIRLDRRPMLCSGCPHNSSTVVPEGSRAMSGIGCHHLSLYLDRNTQTFTQMGGEGVPWVGQAPFTEDRHVFANLGDGTYHHSGSLAVRQAVAAGVNITYKILYNDAVAMTGGQPVDGRPTVPSIANALVAEGVRRVVVVTDEPEKYAGNAGLPRSTQVEHRDDLDRIQRELREEQGVTVLIYDQTCATEKRRRRKRGKMTDPAVRVVINELVCESCGDCSTQSNCMSVVPVETEFGRKRQIDQSGCNKDQSCVKGFCPSFVTVHGGRLRKPVPAPYAKGASGAALPAPELPAGERPWSICVTGVGGTGVVTIGAILGMAAHLEGKGVSVLDMTGLAQKGGTVTSHIRIADRAADLHAVRIAAGGADAVIGCDAVVTASRDCLPKLRPGHTRVVLNIHETITADFTRQRDFVVPTGDLAGDIRAALAGGPLFTVDATRLATELLGDGIAANPFMLGVAWQRGLIPLSSDSIVEAIRLNGTAVEMNISAFELGRAAAVDTAGMTVPEGDRAAAGEGGQLPPLLALRRRSADLDEVIGRRVGFLTDYQNAAYATRYRDLVDRVRAVEEATCPGRSGLTEAVARNYFKLLAYKDEYEVARLHTRMGFDEQLARMFEGDYRVRYHLAPPTLGDADPGQPFRAKRIFGSWVRRLFVLLVAMRRLRGTAFDPFGWTRERRMERRLAEEYSSTITHLLATLEPANHGIAVAIASLPADIRGFGPIKEKSVRVARDRQADLLASYRADMTIGVAAE